MKTSEQKVQEKAVRTMEDLTRAIRENTKAIKGLPRPHREHDPEQPPGTEKKKG
jgi:hypothetical protein